jgi:hypothetical protein
MSKPKNTLKPVLVVPTGTPDRLINAALESGYIPIPTSSPDNVQLLTGSTRWKGDDLLMAALSAIQGVTSRDERAKCVELLWDRIKDK